MYPISYAHFVLITDKTLCVWQKCSRERGEASTLSNTISFLFSSLSILEKLPESGKHRYQTSQCLRHPPHPPAAQGQKRLQLLIWGVGPYISREGRFFFSLRTVTSCLGRAVVWNALFAPSNPSTGWGEFTGVNSTDCVPTGKVF